MSPMPPASPDGSDSFSERLTRLERLNGWLLALTALSLLVAAGALVTSFRPRAQTAMESLVLVDAEGRRSELTAGRLLLADASGPKIALGVEADGSARLALAGRGGATKAELMVYRDAPRFALLHPSGRDFFALSMLVDGSTRLELADGDGRPRAVLGADETGIPRLELLDADGRARAELSGSGSPSLYLEGDDGRIFRAPID